MTGNSRFFGLRDAPDSILRMARVMSIFLPLIAATVTFSTTFYVIFIATALGGGDYIQGMALIGTLIVIQMAVQTVLDYPTGAVGDWIGQRYIISLSFALYGLTFYLVSLVNVTTPYLLLVLIYAINGAADAQQSGAWGAWFDNNYRVAMPNDVDRKQYGVMQGRIGMLFQIVSTVALLPGSLMAVMFGRSWVFQLQAILCVLIAASVLVLVQDLPEVKASRQKRPSFGEYGSLLKAGVSYIFSEPFVKYVMIGTMVTASSILVWGNLILFPMYYAYLATDVAVALFRTLLFIPGVASQERSGIWSRKFEPKKWIPRFRLVQMCGTVFFLLFAAIMYLLPPAAVGTPTIDIFFPFTQLVILRLPPSTVLPVAFMFITFTVTGFFGGFAEILTQRILIDAIPNRIRNSMYSLQPALGTIIAMPQIALFGWLIPRWGFPLTLVSCGIVSLMGVIMISKGLKYPLPVTGDEALVRRQPQVSQPTETAIGPAMREKTGD
ncbi:MAG: hypothetical protein C4K49_05445 [Candidatus Thorarchaeota archaeon]|nr:MAG: hypothetical protein C4K49_05445 [Candidatus Thorarchaeota archaeon]